MSKNPNNFWITKDGEPTENLKLVWYIFDNLYPNFQSRRETVTSKMNQRVTEWFNYLKDEEQRNGQIWYQTRLSYNIRLDSVKSEDYDLYDQLVIKFKK